MSFEKVLLANLERVLEDNPKHPKKKHIIKQKKKLDKLIVDLARGKVVDTRR